jgi:hypothetical protein
MSQPMGHRRIAVGILAGIVILAPTSGAWAQKPAAPPAPAPAATSAADIASAKKHYAEGEKKLKAQDFDGALAEFKAANDIKTAPQAERNIGLCEDNLGHFQSAVDWYEKFLGHVPDKLAAQGEDIKKRVAVIEAMPGKLHVDSNPPGAAVTIDGKAQTGVTPLDVADLPAGPHDVKLTEAGRLPGGKSVDVGFASSQTVTVDLDPEPPPPPPVVVAAAPPAPPPPPPAPVPEQRSLVPAFITGGLAVVAAGVGTVFGVVALNDKSSFDKNPTTSTADNGDTHSLIADMAFGVAVTFGVTSAVLFLTQDEPTPAAASTVRAHKAEAKRDRIEWAPTPMVGPHLAGAGVFMKF